MKRGGFDDISIWFGRLVKIPFWKVINLSAKAKCREIVKHIYIKKETEEKWQKSTSIGKIE